jgi:hypothetical protein
MTGMVGPRVIVGAVFALLGLIFVASTAVLIYEFRELDWLSMVAAHSYLFFFFPTLGLLALHCFYLPSVILVHFFWTYMYSGRTRLFLGLIALAALSTMFARYLDKPPRAIWEATPAALLADKGDPARERAPILEVFSDLRERAQSRVGLPAFGRPCVTDPLLEPAANAARERYCFPAKTLLDTAACCAVQQQFADVVAKLQENPATRSLSTTLDAAFFLPVKVFFVLVIVAIGVLLAIWRRSIDVHYHAFVPQMERGIIIGGLAMLFWPAMDYAYQQMANVLFGRMQSGLQVRLSLVIAPWVVLLMFYFLRRLSRQAETIGQFSAVVVAAVALLRLDQLNDWLARLFGVGATEAILAAQIGLALAGLLALHWMRSAPPSRSGAAVAMAMGGRREARLPARDR